MTARIVFRVPGVAADLLSNSTSSVDVWLRTNVNKDGSAAVCASGAEFTINSYEFTLEASGPITWGAYTNLMPFGWARVSLFDLQGRLMRRVMDERALNAGIHDVRVDGLREDGARLPSGVDSYRVEIAEGASLGRLVIAK